MCQTFSKRFISIGHLRHIRSILEGIIHYLLSMCQNVCICMYDVHAGAWVFVSHVVWMLGTKPRFFVEAGCFLTTEPPLQL